MRVSVREAVTRKKEVVSSGSLPTNDDVGRLTERRDSESRTMDDESSTLKGRTSLTVGEEREANRSSQLDAFWEG